MAAGVVVDRFADVGVEGLGADEAGMETVAARGSGGLGMFGETSSSASPLVCIFLQRLSGSAEAEEVESVSLGCEEGWCFGAAGRAALSSVFSSLPRELGSGRCAWVYELSTVRRRARALQDGLRGVGSWYYAVKANDDARVVRCLASCGFGLECVSSLEVAHCRAVCGPEVGLLFTPNFVLASEIVAAIAMDAEVVFDSADLVRRVAEEREGGLEGVRCGVRLDPGSVEGWEAEDAHAHHEKVRTAGMGQKFGCDLEEAVAVAAAVVEHGGQLVGLHAHGGSGARDSAFWAKVGAKLAVLLRHLPPSTVKGIEWVDLGGGFGVVSKPGDVPIDLHKANEGVELATQLLRDAGLSPSAAIRLEPGRFPVAPAGVLLTECTGVKRKMGQTFVGLATGMHALLRPALYAAPHPILPLHPPHPTTPSFRAQAVGCICESGDVLSPEASFPADIQPGTPLLILNAGAYGKVMSSDYNRRKQAIKTVCIDLEETTTEEVQRGEGEGDGGEGGRDVRVELVGKEGGE